MTLSVVIPCRDAEAYLAETLRSLSLQTRPPDEVIVVDDGSVDRSAEIARAFGDPVRVVAGSGTGGSAARAHGAELAAGDRLMFLDADDLLGPDALASLDAALDDHPDKVALCPWHRWELGPSGIWMAAPPSCRRRHPRDDDLAAWFRGWFHPPAAVLWSREALARSGGWDPDVRMNQDGDVMMRGLVRGNRTVTTRAGTAYYRRSPEPGQSVSDRRRSAAGIDARLDVLARLGRMLDERGDLARYANPLRAAYRDVVADCPPDLAAPRDAAHAAMKALPAQGPRPRQERLFHPGRPGGTPPRGFAPRAAAAGDRDPVVSVIIPVHNRPEGLRRAMESVSSQAFDELELIVVDDASDDGTPDVIAAFDGPRVRGIRLDRNSGVAEARNRGIAAARGRYVAFLDSDDAWLPGKLAAQVAALDAAPPSVALVYGGLRVLGPQGEHDWQPQVSGYVFPAMLAANRMFAAPSTMLVRREVFDWLGGFDSTLTAIEDYDILLRICRFYAVEALDGPLACYDDREAETGGAARRSRRLAANLAARDVLTRRYSADMRRFGVEQGFLLDTSLRALRGGNRRHALHALARAIRRDPRRFQLYGWGALMLMPEAPRRALLAGLRRHLPIGVHRER